LEGAEWIKLAYTGPLGRPLNIVMNLWVPERWKISWWDK